MRTSKGCICISRDLNPTSSEYKWTFSVSVNETMKYGKGLTSFGHLHKLHVVEDKVVVYDEL